MKYGMTLLILSLGLLLSGYSTSDSAKNNPSRATGSATAEADVHEDGELTRRELRITENELNSAEYYGFLLSDYEEPKYIDWNEVFYNGAGLKEVKRTKSIEKEYLNKTGENEIITDLTILSAADVRDFVKMTTGLPYSKMRNPLDWVYLKSFDVYLYEHGDTNQVRVSLISGSVRDGVYTVRYTHNNWWGEHADCEYEVCYTMNGDYYCFISNTPDLATEGAGEYIFPESDSRNLREAELAGMDAGTLRIGRNEIYARHGRKFKDSALQEYFSRKRWYKPTDDPDSKIEQSLNQYEKYNIQFILSHESKAPSADSKTTASSGTGSKTSSSGYTNAQLCKMALDYYEKHSGYRPPIAEIDGTDGDNVTIHLYEDLGDHTATSAWYSINRKTGKGNDIVFGDKIDLTKQ